MPVSIAISRGVARASTRGFQRVPVKGSLLSLVSRRKLFTDICSSGEYLRPHTTEQLEAPSRVVDGSYPIAEPDVDGLGAKMRQPSVARPLGVKSDRWRSLGR